MRQRMRLRTAAVAVIALAVAAPAAMARKSVDVNAAAKASGSACTDLSYTQALAPFGDVNWYFLAPQGSFEGGADGWTTVSGEVTVAGDAGYQDGPIPDTTSLQLGPGATVTSPPICANSSTPSFRFFTKALASTAKGYTVEVTYLTQDGGSVKASGSAVTGTTWAPTPEFRVRTNKIALDDSGWGAIRISITAPSDGAMRIDDLYVDPRMR